MYVYVIVADSTPPLIKIGRSKDPKQRVMDLQVGNGHKLSLYGTVKCWTLPAAMRIEAKAHEDLLAHCVSGEWHAWTPEVREYVDELLARPVEPPVGREKVASLQGKRRPVRRSITDWMAEDSSEPVITVAKRHGIDPKRLRGAIWRELQTGELSLPIGSTIHDRVYDDWRVKAFAEKLRTAL